MIVYVVFNLVYYVFVGIIFNFGIWIVFPLDSRFPKMADHPAGTFNAHAFDLIHNIYLMHVVVFTQCCCHPIVPVTTADCFIVIKMNKYKIEMSLFLRSKPHILDECQTLRPFSNSAPLPTRPFPNSAPRVYQLGPLGFTSPAPMTIIYSSTRVNEFRAFIIVVLLCQSC